MMPNDEDAVDSVVRDARRDWTLNAIGDSIVDLKAIVREHVEDDKRNFRDLNHRLLGSPDRPEQKGLIGTVIDQGGAIYFHGIMARWFAGIFATTVTALIVWLATRG
jgi:hypothetical protein